MARDELSVMSAFLAVADERSFTIPRFLLVLPEPPPAPGRAHGVD
jgi:hypothetical protein